MNACMHFIGLGVAVSSHLLLVRSASDGLGACDLILQAVWFCDYFDCLRPILFRKSTKAADIT